MSLIDQSIGVVRAAAGRFKKKPLADKAGVSDAILRNVQDKNWDPRSTTLRKLENAAAKLVAEHGPDDAHAHRESGAEIPEAAR